MAAVGIEICARNIGHAAIHGLHQHFGGVHIVLQIGKDKQTALRPGKALHALHLLQRAEHAVQLRAIAGADLLHVGTQQVAAQISIHDSLVQVGRVQIVRLLTDNALAKELGLA